MQTHRALCDGSDPRAGTGIGERAEIQKFTLYPYQSVSLLNLSLISILLPLMPRSTPHVSSTTDDETTRIRDDAYVFIYCDTVGIIVNFRSDFKYI